jgi:hypothetical protein
MSSEDRVTLRAVNVERLLPADPVVPRWSSASALVYIGGAVVLLAANILLGISNDGWGEWALVGTSLLATATALAVAVVLEQAERAIAAGVAALLAVVFAAVVVGAVLNVLGLLDSELGDYQPAALFVAAAVVAGSLAALARFRAPILVLPAVLAFWFAVVDLSRVGSWDEAGEVLSVVAGLLLIADGVVVDRLGRRAYGFWQHAVGGLAAGGGLALLAGDVWALTAVIALGFIAAAFMLGRSSYAVLGAVGILIATTLFAVEPRSIVGTFVPFFPPGEASTLEDWQVALAYLVAGLLIAGIGVVGRLAWPGRTGPE